jgi:hypothetical protein
LEAHTFTKQTENFKQKLSAIKLMAKKKRADGEIRATRDHNNVKNILQNTTISAHFTV